jgi:Cys-tRNA(Pro)/Cys-tRNA(Cys) deacylase
VAKRTPSGTPALVALQRHGVNHTVHSYEHDPAVTAYGDEAAAAMGADAGRVYKTLLAEVDGVATVAIVPVTCTLDLKALAAARGAKRAQMMEAPRAERLTGYVVGGISPLGQRTVLDTVIDASALEHATVMVSAGRRGLEIELAPTDLVALTAAAVAPIAQA